MNQSSKLELYNLVSRHLSDHRYDDDTLIEKIKALSEIKQLYLFWLIRIHQVRTTDDFFSLTPYQATIEKLHTNYIITFELNKLPTDLKDLISAFLDL